MFDSDSFFMEVGIHFVWIFLLVGGIFFFLGWKTSCVSAKLYNNQNDTSYTCSDFFWASEQINSQTQTIKIK